MGRKSQGVIKNIIMKLDKPFDCDINMDLNKAINIFVGPNGAGKTVLMKIVWAITNILNTGILNPKVDSIRNAQYIFDNTFDDNNFNGNIELEYENATIKVELDNGKIIDVKEVISPDVTETTKTVFMSKSMRTFDDVHKYLKIRKMCKVRGFSLHSQLEEMQELTSIYKLYDIMYVETLLQKLKLGDNVTASFKDSLIPFGLDKYKIEKFNFDEVSSDIYFENEEGNRTNLRTLSAGEQAMINMFILNG